MQAIYAGNLPFTASRGFGFEREERGPSRRRA
jgi:hypothetical protein